MMTVQHNARLVRFCQISCLHSSSFTSQYVGPGYQPPSNKLPHVKRNEYGCHYKIKKPIQDKWDRLRNWLNPFRSLKKHFSEIYPIQKAIPDFSGSEWHHFLDNTSWFIYAGPHDREFKDWIIIFFSCVRDEKTWEFGDNRERSSMVWSYNELSKRTGLPDTATHLSTSLDPNSGQMGHPSFRFSEILKFEPDFPKPSWDFEAQCSGLGVDWTIKYGLQDYPGK